MAIFLFFLITLDVPTHVCMLKSFQIMFCYAAGDILQKKFNSSFKIRTKKPLYYYIAEVAKLHVSTSHINESGESWRAAYVYINILYRSKRIFNLKKYIVETQRFSFVIDKYYVPVYSESLYVVYFDFRDRNNGFEILYKRSNNY